MSAANQTPREPLKSAVEPTLICGWLSKRRDFIPVQAWRPRWFVLDTSTGLLRYYESQVPVPSSAAELASPLAPKPRGVLRLGSGASISINDAGRSGKAGGSGAGAAGPLSSVAAVLCAEPGTGFWPFELSVPLAAASNSAPSARHRVGSFSSASGSGSLPSTLSAGGDGRTHSGGTGVSSPGRSFSSTVSSLAAGGSSGTSNNNAAPTVWKLAATLSSQERSLWVNSIRGAAAAVEKRAALAMTGSSVSSTNGVSSVSATSSDSQRSAAAAATAAKQRPPMPVLKPVLQTPAKDSASATVSQAQHSDVAVDAPRIYIGADGRVVIQKVASTPSVAATAAASHDATAATSTVLSPVPSSVSASSFVAASATPASIAQPSQDILATPPRSTVKPVPSTPVVVSDGASASGPSSSGGIGNGSVGSALSIPASATPTTMAERVASAAAAATPPASTPLTPVPSSSRTPIATPARSAAAQAASAAAAVTPIAPSATPTAVTPHVVSAPVPSVLPTPSAPVTASASAAVPPQQLQQLPAWSPPGPLPPPWDSGLLEAKIGELKQLASSSSSSSGESASWKKTGTSSGVTTFVPTDGVAGCKGEGFIPFPRQAVCHALQDLEFKRRTDAQYHSGHVLLSLNPQTNIVYWRFHGKVGVSGRDFVNLTHWRIEPDGTLLHVAWSVPHPESPHPEGIVRANCMIGGWIIRPRFSSKSGNSDPFAQTEEGCDVTFLMRSDFMGSIPGFIVRQVAAQQGMLVAVTRDQMATDFGPKGLYGPRLLAQLRGKRLVNPSAAVVEELPPTAAVDTFPSPPVEVAQPTFSDKKAAYAVSSPALRPASAPAPAATPVAVPAATAASSQQKQAQLLPVRPSSAGSAPGSPLLTAPSSSSAAASGLQRASLSASAVPGTPIAASRSSAAASSKGSAASKQLLSPDIDTSFARGLDGDGAGDAFDADKSSRDGAGRRISSSSAASSSSSSSSSSSVASGGLRKRTVAIPTAAEPTTASSTSASAGGGGGSNPSSPKVHPASPARALIASTVRQQLATLVLLAIAYVLWTWVLPLLLGASKVTKAAGGS